MNRLYRSPDDRIIAGVAGGLAESYDLDPALVRVGWAFLMLVTGGLFLLLYIVMAIVVPLRPANMTLWETAAQSPLPGPDAAGGVAPTGPAGGSFGVPPAPGSAPIPNYYYRRHRERRDGSAAFVLGAILIVVGGYFLFRPYVPAIDWDLIWPLIVIGGGALLVIAAISRSRTAS